MANKTKDKRTAFKMSKIKNILPLRHSVPTKRKELITEKADVIFRYEVRAPNDVWSSRDINTLPTYNIINLSKLDTEIIAFKSGPDCGLDYVEGLFTKKKIDIDKIQFKHKQRCYHEKQFQMLEKKIGCACSSLYERNPLNGKLSGEPIADSYLVCSRSNSSVLVVADGVNWGRQAKTASRCAVYACYQYLENKLFRRRTSHFNDPQNNIQSNYDTVFTTEDVLQTIRESLDCAQNLILKSGTPGLTTLCVSVILPLSVASGEPSQFAVCCVNVGDSLAFLISKYYGIREITVASHTTIDNRDFRDTGGALGGVYNDNSPELNNLTYSLTVCDQGDIVLLTTDGVSDNFDPVISKKAMPSSDDIFPFIDSCAGDCGHGDCTKFDKNSNQYVCYCECPCALDEIDCSATQINFTGKLELHPHERQQFALKEIERVWHDTELTGGLDCINKPATIEVEPSSHELCHSIMDEVFKVTSEKRRYLEKQYLNKDKQKSNDSIAPLTSTTTTNNDVDNETTQQQQLIDNMKNRSRRLYAKSHSTAGTSVGPRSPNSVKLRHQMTVVIPSRDFSIGQPPPPPPSLQLYPRNAWESNKNSQNTNSNSKQIPPTRNKLITNPHPGKLDHATIIAAEIGDWSVNLVQSTRNGYHYPL